MNQKNLNTALIMAIALALACKKLQRHTGVHSSDWLKELLDQAINRFNRFTPQQLERFITESFDLNN